MTTYELRKEADKRGLLKDMSTAVNHATLLQRLVQVIVEEEQARGRQISRRASDPSQLGAERLRKERSERKAAAIERSRQRQTDQDYFLSKKLLNVHNKKQPTNEKPAQTDEDQDDTSVINPRRHKVFVR
eukprot:g4035.t1